MRIRSGAIYTNDTDDYLRVIIIYNIIARRNFLEKYKSNLACT